MIQNNTTIKGPPDSSAIPKKSLGRIYYDQLKSRNESKVILINEETSQVFTYKQLLERSVTVAGYLKKLNVEKNDIITIMSPNNWQLVVTVLAGFYVGATINLLNPDYKIGELKHLFSKFTPKIVFCLEKNSTTINKLKQVYPIEHIVTFDQDFEKKTENICLNQENLTFQIEDVDVEEIAFIFTSSGTTGMPKAVALSHANIRNILLYTKHSIFLDFNETETALGYLPFFHIFGSMVFIAGVFYGTKIIILSKFTPETFLEAIQKHKITILFTVPPILSFLVRSPLVTKYNISSIKDLQCGGATASEGLQIEIKDKLGCTVRQNYGLTEAGGAVLMCPRNSAKVGSIGKPTPTVEIKVSDDLDNNKNCNEMGEIRIRGEGNMKGYLGNPEETKEAFDREGFLKTGDLGYFDEEGYFYIVGRLKEIIKYKGFQVSPTELEYIISKLPGVEDVGVIGKPDERAGELPIAFIVKQSDSNLSESEIVQFVEENVSVQKRLYGGVRFVKEIPKNAAGKILRGKLKELL